MQLPWRNYEKRGSVARAVWWHFKFMRKHSLSYNSIPSSRIREKNIAGHSAVEMALTSQNINTKTNQNTYNHKTRNKINGCFTISLLFIFPASPFKHSRDILPWTSSTVDGKKIAYTGRDYFKARNQIKAQWSSRHKSALGLSWVLLRPVGGGMFSRWAVH